MNRPRCNQHREANRIPVSCQTCVRIAVEQRIVKRIVDALLAAGYSLQVNDGDYPRPSEPTRNRTEILKELMEVDDEFLAAFHREGEREGWVRFVYGNDGYDVINDYTTNLENVLAPVNAYAETLEG